MGCKSSKAPAATPKTLLAEAKANDDVKTEVEEPTKTVDENAANVDAVNPTKLEGAANVEKAKVEEDPKQETKDEPIEAAQQESKEEGKLEVPATTDAGENAAISVLTPETKLEGATVVVDQKVEEEPKLETKDEPEELTQQESREDGNLEDPVTTNASLIVIETSAAKTNGWCCK